MFDDDEPTIPRNEPLIKLYELLCSLIEALTPDITSLSLRNGEGERLNAYIDELFGLTHDSKLNDFKLTIRSTERTGSFVTGEAYVRALSGVANYMFKVDKVVGYWCAYPQQPKFSKQAAGLSPTTINNHLNADQQVAQTTSVQVEVNQTIVTLTEKLTNLEHQYPDEASKENKFAKALKKSLPTIKGTLEVVSLAIKVAGQVGLDPHTALKLLGLA